MHRPNVYALLTCLAVPLALLTEPAAAQEVTIPNIETWSFTGFKSVEGQMYYMLRQERNVYDLFHLELYNRDLQKLTTTDVRLGRSWELSAARAIGTDVVFYFYNGKDGLVLKFDQAGQKVKEIHVPGTNVFGSIAAIEPAGGGDFYLAYPIDAAKKGYTVARYGPDLTAKWQKDFAPEKGKYQLKLFRADAAHVYAVSDYSKTGWEVSSLDGSNGNETGRAELQTENATLEPGIATIDKNGRLLLAGTYTDKGPKPVVSVGQGPPRNGFFTLGLLPEGKQEFYNRMPYTEQLATQLNSHSSIQQFTVRNYPTLKLHELVQRPNGGFTLIGETYKNYGFTDADYEAAGGVKKMQTMPGSTSGVGYGPDRKYILDFVLLQFSAQGQLESVKRIPKPYKMFMNRSVGRGPAEFEQKTAFSYRFLDQANAAQEPRLVFLNWHQNLQYVNTVSSTDTRDNLFTRVYLDQPVVAADQDRGELTVREFQNEVTAPNVDLFYDEILPNAPGKFLFTHYDKAAQKLQLKVLNVPAAK